MSLPKGLFELWKNIHYFFNTWFFNWHCRHHCVCSSCTTVYMWDNRLKAKNLPLTIRLFVDRIFINKLYLATTLWDKIKIFRDLSSLDNFLIHVKCLFKGKLLWQYCQNSLWQKSKNWIFFEKLQEICFLPFRACKIQLQRFLLNNIF